MRLRKLNYPLAIIFPHEIWGGKGAGLSSPRRWNHNIGSYYETGVYDEAEIIDSAGRRFRVSKIYLSELSLLSKISATFLSAGGLSGLFDVDMELEQIGTCDQEEFCRKISDLVSESQNWSVTENDKKELQELFDESRTLADAINAVGIFDGWKCEDIKKPLKRVKSEKIVYT